VYFFLLSPFEFDPWPVSPTLERLVWPYRLLHHELRNWMYHLVKLIPVEMAAWLIMKKKNKESGFQILLVSHVQVKQGYFTFLNPIPINASKE
jgi:hypothetical protein